MATKILTAAALMLGISFSAFAGTPKTDAKAKTDTKSDAKVEAKTPAKADAKTTTTLYYWFDAGDEHYIGHTESSGCPNLNDEPCAFGYESVQNESNPVKPTGGADVTETSMD